VAQDWESWLSTYHGLLQAKYAKFQQQVEQQLQADGNTQTRAEVVAAEAKNLGVFVEWDELEEAMDSRFLRSKTCKGPEVDEEVMEQHAGDMETCTPKAYKAAKKVWLQWAKRGPLAETYRRIRFE
jgi:hypothetical protein